MNKMWCKLLIGVVVAIMPLMAIVLYTQLSQLEKMCNILYL